LEDKSLKQSEASQPARVELIRKIKINNVYGKGWIANFEHHGDSLLGTTRIALNVFFTYRIYSWSLIRLFSCICEREQEEESAVSRASLSV